jgi:hypothetical protein
MFKGFKAGFDETVYVVRHGYNVLTSLTPS